MTTGASTGSAVTPASPPSVKARQQAMWASGDFAVIGTTLQIVGELLCEELDLRAGERVLDVAAGNGNATLAAARRFGRVTSTDYVPALLERGRLRAEAEGLDVTFEVADVEALPYSPASFDVVVSTFGVMPIPCRRTSGGPDPVSRKCHKAYPLPVMAGDRPSPRVIAVLLRRRAGRAGRDRRGDSEPSRYANCRFAKRIGSHTPRHASRPRSGHGASRLITEGFRSSHPP